MPFADASKLYPRPGQTGGEKAERSFDSVRLMQVSEIYQFHAWLRGISPLIWRRLLVRPDQSVADLHYALQLAFGWSDFHLHRFRIHGKDFGVYHVGELLFAEDATKVRLADLHFRVGERFLYEYDFGDSWQHQLRLERIRPFEPAQAYPVCIGGKRSAPPEDCGGTLGVSAAARRSTLARARTNGAYSRMCPGT
jgi:hypothetical protein